MRTLKFIVPKMALVALYLLNGSKVVASPCSIQVLVDGVPMQENSAKIKIPTSTRTLGFRVGDSPVVVGLGSNRKRFMLEGYDPHWLEKSGQMSFNICFFDKGGSQIERKSFPSDGSSPGWDGSVEKSNFSHRRETVNVPLKAERMTVCISSAGPPATEGIFLVKGVVVSRVPKAGLRDVILDSAGFLQARSADTEAAKTWTPNGTNPSMATVVKLQKQGAEEKAFCLLDDDPLAHAEWDCSEGLAGPIIPGEPLIIDWDEIYNNGLGDQCLLGYDLVSCGDYRFRAQQLDIYGNPLPVESFVGIVIPVHFWKNKWVWASCGIATLAVLFFGAKGWIRAKIRRDLDLIRSLEKERLRISRDLHDDLGARLTHISLLSAHTANQKSVEETNTILQEISGMTGELISAVSEVVWTENPENDNLESLVSFLCQIIYDLCSPASIRCRVDALGLMDERPVECQIRRNVTLAVKEAVTNALKHSGASEISANIQFDEPLLIISISDNGNGGVNRRDFNRGNGLANMEHRMASINAKAIVERIEGKGTMIRFEIPIP